MAQLLAYLAFNGNCKEAMEFYKGCFEGELILMTHGQSPMAAQAPPELRDKIMHSSLQISGKMVLMGADSMGGEEYKHGNANSLCLVCESKAEIERLFSRLSAGGRVAYPLKEEFFGTYGQLTDKYGFGW